MKKIFSFLLVFIVLLSSFVVPVFAVDDDIINNGELVVNEVNDGFYPKFPINDDFADLPDLFEDEEEIIQDNNASVWSLRPGEDPVYDDYRLSRYIYQYQDSSNNEATFHSFGVDIDGLLSQVHASPTIDFSNNVNGKFYEYVSLWSKDQSVLLPEGANVKFELSNLYITSQVQRKSDSTVVYSGSCSQLPQNMSVRVFDYSGVMHVLDETNCKYTVRKSSSVSGAYDIIIDIYNLDYDITRITYKFPFYYKDFGSSINYSTTSYSHRFNWGFSNSKITLTVTEADKTSGILATIGEWLKKIWDGITGLPDMIASALSGLFASLENGVMTVWVEITGALTDLGNFIIDGLQSLFIPSDGYFNTLFDNFSIFFEEKLGVLVLPFEVIADFMDLYLNIDEGSGKLVWTDISIPIKNGSYKLISAGEIDFKSAFNTILNNYYPVYYAFIDCFLYFLLIRFAKRKYDSVIGSGQVSFESGTE